MKNEESRRERQFGVKLSLIGYDFVIFCCAVFLIFIVYQGQAPMTVSKVVFQSCAAAVCIFSIRWGLKIYRQIWRYGGIQCYIRLMVADGTAFVLCFVITRHLTNEAIAFSRLLSFYCINLLGCLAIRMIYRYAYKCGNRDDVAGKILRFMLKVCTNGRVVTEADPDEQKIKIAILGAGTVGVGLAEELLANPKSKYIPRCFIDNDPLKSGRTLHGIMVLPESQTSLETLKTYNVQEIVFAVPTMPQARRVELFEMYHQEGFKIEVYDFPLIANLGSRRQMREFSMNDLLMREPKEMINDFTREYYKDKVILITGGGGSIGSEICRQLAKMEPKQLIIVDIYENCAYDLRQELLLAYKNKLDIRIEIVSIANKKGLARVFAEYYPEICINAAAHKHVPLMEKNCIEAVQNNVFGTLNVIQLCEEYGCKRFMMLSTDKAVNPTNVMGATKRMCEMIMSAYSTRGKVKCSATRFGNVLGSAGSVIPLFQRQIAAGGPITLTDKRIIRYFMTIPEASQLVLTSGAMANNGDLFVLDMGKPVKIYDLAQNMIQFSGIDGIEIIETGLRPGEKLYEELLTSRQNLEKTDNDLIFVEHEETIGMIQLEEKLAILRKAVECDDEKCMQALKAVVPTYHSPETVNAKAAQAREMKAV